MNKQPVKMREGQTLQCCVCLRMKNEVWADLDGKAFKAYYCWDCITKLSVKEEEQLQSTPALAQAEGRQA